MKGTPLRSAGSSCTQITVHQLESTRPHAQNRTTDGRSRACLTYWGAACHAHPSLAGNDTYGARREGSYDDVVLRVVLAVWSAERSAARRLISFS